MYTTCRVGVLSSEISKHSKISPPPSLRSHLTSSPMGVLSGDYGTCIKGESTLPINKNVHVQCHVYMYTYVHLTVHDRYSYIHVASWC